MKKLYILTLFICLAGFGTSFAQTLKGHIYDANTNEPLVGAAVTYKLHGNQGTVSDINGAYEIKLPEGGVDLVFSYIGYEDVLMPIVIGKREVITKDVYMKESTKLLEEVVVSAGRFEQKLSNVTVSMDLVKAGDIAPSGPDGYHFYSPHAARCGYSGQTAFHAWRQRMDLRSRCPQPDSGRRNEHTESQDRRNQLEYRTSRKHRTDRSHQGSLIRFVRFVCSQRYYQYPYRPSGVDTKNPLQCLYRHIWRCRE